MAVGHFQVLFVLGKTELNWKSKDAPLKDACLFLCIVSSHCGVWDSALCPLVAGVRAVQCAVVPELWVAVTDLCPKAFTDHGLRTGCWCLHVCLFWDVIKVYISASQALYQCGMEIATLYRASLFWGVRHADSCQPNCKKVWKNI